MTEAYKPNESLAPTHVDNLNILVHPLYIVDTAKYPFGWMYHEARENLAENAVTRFAPRASTEVTLIMPNTFPWKKLLGNVREVMEFKKAKPNEPTWLDIADQLRAVTAFPRNVRLVGNIGLESNPGGEVVVDRLTEMGFAIDGSTKITMGGEWLQICVDSAAQKLLKLPFIDLVRIDKNVTNPSQEIYFRRGYMPFDYGSKNYMTEDADFYYLHKA